MKSSLGILANAILVLIGALLLALAFSSPQLSALAFLALVPLILTAARSRTPGEAFLLGLLFGAVFLLGALAWMVDPSALAVLAIGGQTTVFIGLISVSLATLSGGAALFGLWAWVVRLTYRDTAENPSFAGYARFLLLVPLAFVAMEYFRMLGFGAIFAGPGGLPEPFFSFGFLGYIGGDFPGLLQLARVGEVFALSFLFCFINMAVAAVLMRREARVHRAALLLMLVACVAGLELGLRSVAYASPGQGINLRVAAVGMFPDEDRIRYSGSFLESSILDLDSQTFVILPEGGAVAPGAPVLEGEAAPTILVAEGRVGEDGFRYESFLVPEGVNKESFRTGKAVLVPFGEYVPSVARPLLAVLAPDILTWLDSRKVLPYGEPMPLQARFGEVGVVFCNEVWSPRLARRQAALGADIIAVPASYAWFADSKPLDRATLLALKVRAVASGVPMVQATKGGESVAVAPSGRVIGSAAAGTLLDVRVPFSPD